MTQRTYNVDLVMSSRGLGSDFKAWNGACPDCKGATWNEGPRGGACINLQCVGCGTWLNVLDRPGILAAHRIEKKP